MARDPRRLTGQTLRLPRLAGPLREFIATQGSSAVVLLAATVAALVWANSPWSASYEDFWDTTLAIRVGGSELSLDFRHWVNDGLMALFFLIAGVEIRRQFEVRLPRDGGPVEITVDVSDVVSQMATAAGQGALSDGDGMSVHWTVTAPLETVAITVPPDAADQKSCAAG